MVRAVNSGAAFFEQEDKSIIAATASRRNR
jgi:hypothetical protein